MDDNFTTKVIRIVEDPLLNPIGGITRRYRITYMLGAHGPYSITMDVAGFTADAAKAAIEAAAAPLRALLSS